LLADTDLSSSIVPPSFLQTGVDSVLALLVANKPLERGIKVYTEEANTETIYTIAGIQAGNALLVASKAFTKIPYQIPGFAILFTNQCKNM